MAVGMVALPVSFQLHGIAASITDQQPATVLPADPRVHTLHGFFKKLDCPIANLAPDFVRVADANNLDWRLLPSIAVLESGGGKVYRNNNIFGWNNGNKPFASIKSGLEVVAFKLGKSPLYSKYDSLGKLRIYNSNQQYADEVISLMNRISPPVRTRTVEAQPQITRSFRSLLTPWN